MHKLKTTVLPLAFAAALAGCMQPEPQVQNVAGGAALGAAATAIAGGNTNQVIAGGIVGATAGALIPTN